MDTAQSENLRCDVLVIGGGPAGSTVSALLADKGWRVVLLEKERYPRFHIGESLLPMNLPILERLGVLEQVEAIGIPKYGAHFVSDDYPDQDQTYYFSFALDKNHPHAYEVRRSEFDHLLLKNSASKGVEVHEGVRVTHVELADGAVVQAKDEHGQIRHWRARQVIDASGRHTFLATRLGSKQKNPRHASAAIFGHFKNAQRLPGRDAGNISIFWFKHGWLWMIPLHDGIMSVGAVCWPEYLKTRRATPPEDFLWQTIGLCPGVSERMQSATLLGEARATGNYSYCSSRLYGDGWLLVGDAFAFVDPVFSSGVYLAMNSACLGAEVVDARLRDTAAAPRLARAYERRVRRGLRTFSWFIYRFTAPPMHHLFMAPSNRFRMQEAVISVLAGDVFGKTPISRPLILFKAIYYAASARYLAGSLRAWWRRRRNAGATFTSGTTPLDQSG
ncbi:MAG: tryptophan 7-halogenase [Nitrococcus sp.]|nr:tryptophan 7-halogenase [Nitrococcus sp.]